MFRSHAAAASVAHRFFQYSGGLALSTIGLGELFTGAYKHPTPARFLTAIADLLTEVTLLDFDAACAEQVGKLRGALR